MKKISKISILLLILSLFVSVVSVKADTLVDTIEIPTIASLGVGTRPLNSAVLNNKVYRVNQTSSDISIIDAVNNYVIKSLSVTSSPKIAVTANNKVYVFGLTSPASIINTSDDISGNIIISGDTATVVGNYIYLTSSATTSVTVIDSTNDSIVASVAVGSGAKVFKTVNDRLYVANASSNNVSVINTSSNTFIKNISVGTSPQYITYYNNKLYVSNYSSGNVSVIDTSTEAFVKNITTGTNSNFSIEYNGVIYVANWNGSTISVINTSTDTVTTNISSSKPTNMMVANGKLYVGGTQDGKIRIYNMTNNTFISSVTIFSNSNMKIFGVVGNYLYVASQSWSGDVTPSAFVAIDITTDTSAFQYDFGKQPSSFALVNNKFFVNYEFSDNMSIIDTSTNSVIKTIADTIIPEAKPVSATLVGTKLYVNNYASSSVSVIDTETNSIVNTILVGTNPVSSTQVGSYLYVNNYGSNNISIINTGTDVLTQTISLNTKPLSSKYKNNKLYVNNEGLLSNSLSIINTTNNILLNDLYVGSSTYSSTLVGDKLYLNQYGSNVVEIDTNTDSVLSNISVGLDPVNSVATGTKLYIINNQSNSVSVYNTLTSQVTNTLNVGVLPYSAVYAKGKLYVFASDNVSVIDTTNDTVVSTIDLAGYREGSTFIGKKIYAINYSLSTLAIISTDDDSIFQTISVGLNPNDIQLVGDRVFTINKNANNISVIQGDDYTAPIILGIQSAAYQTRATITWTTTESSISTLHYGINGSYKTLPSSGGNLATTHTAVAEDLLPNTAYDFNISAIDSAGNSTTTADMRFITTQPVNLLMPGSSSGDMAYINNIFKATTTIEKLINKNSCYVFKSNIRPNNRGSEIVEIKKFLNKNLDIKLNINSNIYDSSTFNAVKKFQLKYKNNILIPLKLKNPTGLWFNSTKSFANSLCK